MALQLTKEEHDRLQQHMKNNQSHAYHGGGIGARTPEHVKQLIFREYRNGNSINGINRDYGISRDVSRVVLREAGLRS